MRICYNLATGGCKLNFSETLKWHVFSVKKTNLSIKEIYTRKRKIEFTKRYLNIV